MTAPPLARRAAIAGLLCLIGCPDLTYTDDGMWQCWPETAEQTVGDDGVVIVWVDSDEDGDVNGTLFLDNYGTGVDCPVAVYQSARPPERDNAPELVAGEAPPDRVDGLGDLVYAALLAPESNARVEWSGPMPVYVTVVACPGLIVPGEVINAPCKADVGPAK